MSDYILGLAVLKVAFGSFCFVRLLRRKGKEKKNFGAKLPYPISHIELL